MRNIGIANKTKILLKLIFENINASKKTKEKC